MVPVLHVGGGGRPSDLGRLPLSDCRVYVPEQGDCHQGCLFYPPPVRRKSGGEIGRDDKRGGRTLRVSLAYCISAHHYSHQMGVGP